LWAWPDRDSLAAGDGSDRVLAAITAAAESGDGRDQCTGWLSSVVLGRLPPGLAAPVSLAGSAGPGRSGAAVAALQFGAAWAPHGGLGAG
jgi:hypothetical protein